MDILARRVWERKFFDLWSIVHILNGVCLGFVIFFYHTPFIESFIIFLFLTIAWEILEYYKEVHEHVANQIVDIIIGALGFLATVQFVPILAPTFQSQIIYFTASYTIAWLFAYYGFQSFAKYFDRNMLKRKKYFFAAIALYIIIIGTILNF